MKLLVPLPFNITCQEHGRNLRVAHLLDELSQRCTITCAAADDAIAASATMLLPRVDVVVVPGDSDTDLKRVTTSHGAWWLRRAADFFGYNPNFHAWIDRLSMGADAVLGFDLISALYLTGLGRHATRPAATLCDLIDDPWLTFRSGRFNEQLSTVGFKTAIAVRTLRRHLLPHIDMVVAVAPRDADRLARTTGLDVRVVPNGVKLPNALPNPAGRERLIIFTGAMSFPPNEQAARYLVRKIWPRVRRMIPDANIALVGADPGPSVRALGKEPGVIVTGRVEDMQIWLRRARVATAPMLSGTGLKNKILEAAAQGCPVVATSLASNGIPCGEGNGILIADDPASFAAHLVHLMTDPQCAERTGLAAAAMVRERFSWSHVADTLWTALQDCRSAAGQVIDDRRTAVGRFVTPPCEPSIGKEVTIHAAT